MGHVPLPSTSNNLFCSASIWSYRKYDGNLSYVKYFQYLRATVIKISSFFHFSEKNERVYRIFLHHGVYLSPILCYYNVVLCPSSIQILATPL